MRDWYNFLYFRLQDIGILIDFNNLQIILFINLTHIGLE